MDRVKAVQKLSKMDTIKFTQIGDKLVCHFFSLLSEKEKYEFAAPENAGIDAVCAALDNQYNFAVKKARKLGGRKYHNKKYGGGIAFYSNDPIWLNNEIQKLIQ